MVLYKNIQKGRKKGGRKESTEILKDRWDKLRNIHYVPKVIKTPLDFKKKEFNSKQARNLLEDHYKTNIKNITKKVKNFGFKRERVVIGYKIGKNKNKIPVYKSEYKWDPPEYALKAYPDLKYKKERLMFSKDTAKPLAYIIIKAITKAKEDIYRLKRSQPKRGHGLITKKDIDIVFGRNIEYNHQPNNNNSGFTKNNNQLSDEKIKIKFGEVIFDMLTTSKQSRKKKKKKKRNK